MLTAFAVLLCLSALLAWANERWVHLPSTVAVTLAGAASSIVLILLDTQGWTFGLKQQAIELWQALDFTAFVLNGILSLMLFAGAMSLDATLMMRLRAGILTFAGVSTAISTVLIGFGAWGVFHLVGLDIPLIWSLLFGALLSPTDPVAVLDMLKRAKVPKKIETLIAGESLFNDGVGVVFFIVIASAAGVGGGHTEPSLTGALVVFVQEALGGIAFGALIGWITYRLCRSIEAASVEILLTLASVVGGYVLAASLGLSGPLAMVVAGLVMSAGKERAFGEHTRERIEGFWETLDEVLNILLFAFIGLDVLLTPTAVGEVLAGLLMIVVALVARFVSVALPMTLVRRRDGYGPWTIRVLTWGGLRGGIAISLALGLPASPYRSALVTATYVVVLFTIAVQGLTVMPIVRRAAAAEAAAEAAAGETENRAARP
ncbi:MAG: sodium:proton antiporter [Actinomycetales bacterium]|uniref:Sodium:proton antiporter n=1 Tax=Candidatus Phosphoribacter hodrii TaxID=2953743 RepID=A0A935MIL3_9MICO|nr:sodium:proton antiporter [Candidatus Phosphoribacter hodrii]OPZ55876.1 MAG: Na(+)/H(+) antiporter NhaP [bacterium ADurb.BinA028]HNV14159.1 sodium:proton antiporter [Dermatophilaceae bacterium]MBK7274302.1 sodium:proton antiporter [Candidatus Phosphoribacter hodrii]MBL0003794.1 sodium:proton antiporter [Candidatus Phosphoribacter hodrii]